MSQVPKNESYTPTQEGLSSLGGQDLSKLLISKEISSEEILTPYRHRTRPRAALLSLTAEKERSFSRQKKMRKSVTC